MCCTLNIFLLTLLFYLSSCTVINIGGVFRTFDFYYNNSNAVIRNELGILQLAAFLMAIDQFNNKTDGMFDNLLRNTTVKFTLDVNQRTNKKQNYYMDGAIAAYHVTLFTHNLLGVVNGLSDESSYIGVGVFNGWGIPTIGVNSTISDLSHSASFPLNTRIIHSDYYRAAAIYKVLNHYSWRRVALLYTSDTLGQDAFTTFEYFRQQDSVVTYLYVSFFLSTQSDLSSEIDDIKATGATIIVLLMSESATARFLVQAYDYGLLTTETQIIGMALETSVEALYAAGAKTQNIPDILKGYLTVDENDILLYQAEEGKLFLQKFRQLSPTMKRVNGSVVCSQRTDNSILTDNYLHQAYTFVSPDPVCLGVESFSKYTELNLDPKVLYAYSGAVVLLGAVDYLISEYGFSEDEITPGMIFMLMTNSTANDKQFPTAAGNISFFEGIPSKNYFARGDRFKGYIYGLKNFREDLFDNNPSSLSPMTTVGIIDDNGVIECSNIASAGYSINCSNPVFRGGTKTPSDMKQSIYQLSQGEISMTFYLLGSTVIASAIGYSCLITYNTKNIMMTSYALIMIHVFGWILGGLRIIFAGMDVTTSSCVAQFWLEHLTFRFVFVFETLMLWRIDQLLHCQKDRPLCDNTMLVHIAFHVSVAIVALIIATATHTIGVAHSKTVSNNQETNVAYCSRNISLSPSLILLVLYVSEIWYILMAVYYLIRTRAVTAIIAKAKMIAVSLTWSVVVIIVIFMLAGLTSVNAHDLNVDVTVGFFATLFLCIMLHTRFTYNESINENRKVSGNNSIAIIQRSGIHGRKKSYLNNKEAETRYQAAANLVRGFGTFREKSKFIQANIDAWKALVAKLAEDSDLSKGSIDVPSALVNGPNNDPVNL